MARPQHMSDDSIIDALAGHPQMTSAEVADALGIGQSTAAKRLVALEVAGMVKRDAGGRVNGVRVADRWSALGPSPSRTRTSSAAAKETGKKPAGGAGGDRLSRGTLGALVREFLAARPEETFGPNAVGKALGRSQGAVSNSLASMASRGEVELVGDKPRRYRIVADR